MPRKKKEVEPVVEEVIEEIEEVEEEDGDAEGATYFDPEFRARRLDPLNLIAEEFRRGTNQRTGQPTAGWRRIGYYGKWEHIYNRYAALRGITKPTGDLAAVAAALNSINETLQGLQVQGQIITILESQSSGLTAEQRIFKALEVAGINPTPQKRTRKRAPKSDA